MVQAHNRTLAVDSAEVAGNPVGVAGRLVEVAALVVGKLVDTLLAVEGPEAEESCSPLESTQGELHDLVPVMKFVSILT